MDEQEYRERSAAVAAREDEATAGGGAGAAATNEGAGEEKPVPLSERLPKARRDLPAEERPAEAMRIAQEAFALTGQWVAFYREILGAKGVVAQLFPDEEARRRFAGTYEYDQIQQMLSALRSQDETKADLIEPQKMITVRLPQSLHDALRVEADRFDTSINKLCISKLLQPLDAARVPKEAGKRRGRRPGPQKPQQEQGGESEPEQVIAGTVEAPAEGRGASESQRGGG